MLQLIFKLLTWWFSLGKWTVILDYAVTAVIVGAVIAVIIYLLHFLFTFRM